MDDNQKWLEAATGIEEDIHYLKSSLSPQDLTSLQIALAVYLKNARTGVNWPRPDDLYCIETRGCEFTNIDSHANPPGLQAGLLLKRSKP